MPVAFGGWRRSTSDNLIKSLVVRCRRMLTTGPKPVPQSQFQFVQRQTVWLVLKQALYLLA